MRKIAVLAVATFLLAPTAAFACDIGYREDGGFVTWCFHPSLDDNPKSRGQAVWALDNLESHTVRNADQQNCNSSTDLVMQDTGLPEGIYGRARFYDCQNSGGVVVCSQWTINQSVANQKATNTGQFTQDPFSNGDPDPGELKINLKKTWCHEIGHAMGLNHHPAGDGFQDRSNYYNESTPDRVNDCMVRLHIESPGDWLRYNFHHRNQDIGDFY